MELRGKLLSRNGTALVICLLAVGLGLSTAAQAQTFTVLHSFTGGADGANPAYGLTLSAPGRLYGVTSGTAFQMRQYGPAWVLSPLANLGDYAHSRITVGPDGSLYGSNGGDIYNLRPPATTSPTVFPQWTETIVYQFGFFHYGSDPMGDLVFDAAGNMYGTTELGGVVNTCSGGLGCGVVYELSLSSGIWTNVRDYIFTGQSDGAEPESGVLLDQVGNAYVTSSTGYYDDAAQWGSVIKLTPSGPSQWSETTLYEFQNGGGIFPAGGLIFDSAGNLYGATSVTSESGGGGTVYELTPSGGAWNFSNLYTLTGGSARSGPRGKVLMDSAGNLYGTTYAEGAYGKGSVFELTPGMGGWNYVSLHDFTGGSDGANPMDGLVMDAGGNLYGTSYAGGNTNGHCAAGVGYQCGVVFEITP